MSERNFSGVFFSRIGYDYDGLDEKTLEKMENESLVCFASVNSKFPFFIFPTALPDQAFDSEYDRKLAAEKIGHDFLRDEITENSSPFFRGYVATRCSAFFVQWEIEACEWRFEGEQAFPRRKDEGTKTPLREYLDRFADHVARKSCDDSKITSFNGLEDLLPSIKQDAESKEAMDRLREEAPEFWELASLDAGDGRTMGDVILWALERLGVTRAELEKREAEKRGWQASEAPQAVVIPDPVPEPQPANPASSGGLFSVGVNGEFIGKEGMYRLADGSTAKVERCGWPSDYPWRMLINRPGVQKLTRLNGYGHAFDSSETPVEYLGPAEEKAAPPEPETPQPEQQGENLLSEVMRLRAEVHAKDKRIWNLNQSLIAVNADLKAHEETADALRKLIATLKEKLKEKPSDPATSTVPDEFAYDWDLCPSWVKWQATDKWGTVLQSELEPVALYDRGVWMYPDIGRFQFAQHARPATQNWRESKRQRPDSTKEKENT